MGIFHYFSILMIFTAVFSYINHRYIKLPSTIGVMLISLVLSVYLIVLGQVFPEYFMLLCHAVEEIDFTELLLEVLLSFLIFAGAYEFDTKLLFKERVNVLLMATVSTILSTFIVGILMYYACSWLGMNVPFIHTLLFGALISPTDPIAVLAILKKAGVPKSIETDIAGESLLNDGVAVVIFLTIFGIAQQGVESVHASDVALLFVKEVFGGAILGLIMGWGGVKLIQTVHEDKIAIMITLAVVMGGYAMAESFHVSGPLAIVATGLLMSYFRERDTFEDTTKASINMFWGVLDDTLNAILFLFIGIEMLAISAQFHLNYIWMGLVGIIVVLLSRIISVLIPFPLTSLIHKEPKKVFSLLVWGGLRGGISVALALSLEDTMSRDLLVSVTYSVVLFSIIVQGLTIEKLVHKLGLSK